MVDGASPFSPAAASSSIRSQTACWSPVTMRFTRSSSLASDRVRPPRVKPAKGPCLARGVKCSRGEVLDAEPCEG